MFCRLTFILSNFFDFLLEKNKKKERHKSERMPFVVFIRTAHGGSLQWHQKTLFCQNEEERDQCIDAFYESKRSERKVLIEWGHIRSVFLKEDREPLEMPSEWLIEQFENASKVSMIWLNLHSLDFDRVHIYCYDTKDISFAENGLDTVVISSEFNSMYGV